MGSDSAVFPEREGHSSWWCNRSQFWCVAQEKQLVCYTKFVVQFCMGKFLPCRFGHYAAVLLFYQCACLLFDP